MSIANGQVADANDVLKSLTASGYIAPAATSSTGPGGIVTLTGNLINLAGFTSPLTITQIDDGSLGRVGFLLTLRNLQFDSIVIISAGTNPLFHTPHNRDIVLSFGDSVTLVQIAPLINDVWEIVSFTGMTPEQNLFNFNNFS